MHEAAPDFVMGWPKLEHLEKAYASSINSLNKPTFSQSSSI